MSLNLYAGEMSSIDLLVRETASEDYGYIFYDEWSLSITTPVTGCLITVKAKASYVIGGEVNPIEALYCINRNKNNSYVLKPITGEK